MPSNLQSRSLMTLFDCSPDELLLLLRLATTLKAAKYGGHEVPRLKGKSIALIAERDSPRTRAFLEVAAHDQGARVAYLGARDEASFCREDPKDTVRVLGRLYDAIEYRGLAQERVEELACYAGVPVFNGLTGRSHPTQFLSDVMTMGEFTGRHHSDISFCFLGNARSEVACLLLLGAARIGMDVRLGAPRSLWPDERLMERCRSVAAATGARITLTEEVEEAVANCHGVYTDRWVSMDEPEEAWEERIHSLQPYRVTREVMRATGNPHARFMHCLPAFHDRDALAGERIYRRFGMECMEVDGEVFESPASVVFDQAENRMHAMKAFLVATL